MFQKSLITLKSVTEFLTEVAVIQVVILGQLLVDTDVEQVEVVFLGDGTSLEMGVEQDKVASVEGKVDSTKMTVLYLLAQCEIHQ